MYALKVKEIERTYKNAGQHAEQALAFTLTNEMRKHNSMAFDQASDIPEFNMSVKSSRFTLASASMLEASDKEGQIAEYFKRVHSTHVAYVTKDFSKAYVMDMAEFKKFIELFCSLTRESTKNGGGKKLKCRAESKKMIEWFVKNI